jgi:hypothetical protein
MSKRNITRFEAVRDQLDCAIRAYFLWDDLVSALTLVGAAERVLSDMQPQDGILGVDAYSIRSALNLHIKPEYQKRAGKFFRKDYDFFRHADHNPQSDYELNGVSVDFWLMMTVGAFEFMGQQKTPEMRAFLVWYMAKYPHLIKDDAPHKQLASEMAESAKSLSKKDYFLAFTAAVSNRPGTY